MTQFNARRVNFRPDHFVSIKPRPEQMQDTIALCPDNIKLSYGQAVINTAAKNKNGLNACTTLVVNGRPIACFGIMVSSPGICEGWGVFSEEVKEHRVKVFSTVKYVIDSVDFVRLQITCRDDFPVGKRMLTRLGLVEEAILRKATPDYKDLCIYSIVR